MYFDQPNTPFVVARNPHQADTSTRLRRELEEPTSDLPRRFQVPEDVRDVGINRRALEQLRSRELITLHAGCNRVELQVDHRALVPRQLLGDRIGRMPKRNYPTNRADWPVCWLARPGASPDVEPLPKRTRDRTLAIRRLFLEQLGGHATLDDVGAAAEAAGLLDTLGSFASAKETIRRALRPVVLPMSAHGPRQGAVTQVRP